MKKINVELSDEAYLVIVNYKVKKGLTKLDDALDKILLKIKKC